MKKYPSIEQYRNIIKKVRINHDYQGNDEQGNPIYQHLTNYPKLQFKGTVKLHGTNAGIVKYINNSIIYQSRERELSLQQDNAGFMLNMSNVDFSEIFDKFEFKEYVAIYGEWCGSNIQKGVALAELPKIFVIFGIKVDDKWINLENLNFNSELFNKQNVYIIEQFPTYNVEIDFENPELIQNTLIDLTIKVEEECPVGKYFNISGIGEGIVFTSTDYPDLKFKSKGEKHSVSKVKILNSVNEEELNSLNEFVEYSVTENRLNQALQNIKDTNIEVNQKLTGEFLKYICNDILKEESDVLIKNQIEWKKVASLVANKSRIWFFNNL